MFFRIGVDSVNNDVNSNGNKQPEVLANNEVNAVPNDQTEILTETNTSQGVNNQHENTEILEQVVDTTRRVKVVNDKPSIQTMLPNTNVNVSSVSNAINEEKTLVDSNSVIPPMKEVKVEPGKSTGSKFQTFMLILLFGGLFLMIIFLPQISEFIELKKYENSQIQEVITTGTLKCTLDDSTDKFDLTYSLDFSFTDSRLTRLNYVLETRGDAKLDEAELEALKTKCDKLALSAKQLSGISVSCYEESGSVTQKQVFNYTSIDVDEAMTAYVEAGGNYPDYENGQDISEVEKNMNASGFTCERIK